LTHKSRKKLRNFMLKCWMFSFWELKAAFVTWTPFMEDWG
jgi:hypothetical protein